MSKLSKRQRRDIVTKYKAGIKNKDLVTEYGVSRTTITKITKGIGRDFVPIVQKQIDIEKDKLTRTKDENYIIDVQIEKSLADVARIAYTRKLTHDITDKNLMGMLKLLKKGKDLTVLDHKLIQETTDKATLTTNVNPRHAKQEINIDNSNTAPKLTIDDIYGSDSEDEDDPKIQRT